jgi:hypothetical protein
MTCLAISLWLFARAALQVFSIVPGGLADEPGLALEAAAAGTHHYMQIDCQTLAQAEFSVQALGYQRRNVAATTHVASPFFVSID